MSGKNSIETICHIPFSPRQVWSVLADIRHYGDWNPFITAISGRLEPDARMEITIQPDGKDRAQTFRPKIIRFVPEQELRWVGHFLIPNLVFSGEHYFILTPEEGGVRFVHGEKFWGLAIPFVGVQRFKSGFERMNRALADEVARRAGRPFS